MVVALSSPLFRQQCSICQTKRPFWLNGALIGCCSVESLVSTTMSNLSNQTAVFAEWCADWLLLCRVPRFDNNFQSVSQTKLLFLLNGALIGCCSVESLVSTTMFNLSNQTAVLAEWCADWLLLCRVPRFDNNVQSVKPNGRFG